MRILWPWIWLTIQIMNSLQRFDLQFIPFTICSHHIVQVICVSCLIIVLICIKNRSLFDLCMNILNRVVHWYLVLLLILCFYCFYVFSCFLAMLYMYCYCIDVRLSHLNNDYLLINLLTYKLTYLLTYLLILRNLSDNDDDDDDDDVSGWPKHRGQSVMIWGHESLDQPASLMMRSSVSEMLLQSPWTSISDTSNAGDLIASISMRRAIIYSHSFFAQQIHNANLLLSIKSRIIYKVLFS